MIEIKALSIFQGNPQSRDQEPDFWNRFRKQTQQSPCTSITLLKGPGPKKAKKEQLNRHNKLSCTCHERAINNSTKMEIKQKKYDIHPLSPHPNPNINEPLPNLLIPPITWSNRTMIMIALARSRKNKENVVLYWNCRSSPEGEAFTTFICV